MRAIIGSGYLVAMQELGLNDIFDYIYGTSAGALGGAYFLSKQSPYGITIFFEDVNNSDFISYRSMPPFMNIDYLMDVIQNKKRLDVKAVKHHPTNLLITATEVKSGEVHYFSNHDDNVDLLTALKASCALPVYYDKPVKINGHSYLDGGIVSSLPVLKAISDGCTHILILMTDGKRRLKRPPIPFWYELWHLRKYGRGFVKDYYGRQKHFRNILEVIEGHHPDSQNINIAALAPHDIDLSGHTTDANKLKKAYQLSYQYAIKLFTRY